jgi:hypothetical protein
MARAALAGRGRAGDRESGRPTAAASAACTSSDAEIALTSRRRIDPRFGAGPVARGERV